MKNNDEHHGSEGPSQKTDQYVYRSAGISERPGRVPLWLFLVMIGLFVWGTYYLFAYWSPA